MLAKRIIPCLDVDKGRVIKGVKFVEHVDAGDPVEQAKFYDREKADELVFYDITASAEARQIMLDVVKRTSEEVFIPLTVGGGIRTIEDIKEIIQGGADKISLNTAAVKNPEIITSGAESFGNQCIVVSIDAKRVQKDSQAEPSWEVYINGGRTPTGINALEWAQEAESLGAGELVLNSIDADGTKDGYDLVLNRTVDEKANIPIVASGGCGNLEHIYQVLTAGKASAALAASIFHFREYSIQEAKDYLSARKVLLRR